MTAGYGAHAHPRQSQAHRSGSIRRTDTLPLADGNTSTHLLEGCLYSGWNFLITEGADDQYARRIFPWRVHPSFSLAASTLAIVVSTSDGVDVLDRNTSCGAFSLRRPASLGPISAVTCTTGIVRSCGSA